MIPQIALATAVELFLILLTCLFLMKPESVFGDLAKRRAPLFTWLGFFMLCLTFCWSVILGGIFYLNDVVIRI